MDHHDHDYEEDDVIMIITVTYLTISNIHASDKIHP